MRKKEPEPKRLTLDRQTIRALNTTELGGVGGGLHPDTMSDASVCPCVAGGEGGE